MKSEMRLLANARRGDEHAIRTLIDTYSPQLYNIAMKILRNPQDAEDALQEAFIAAISKLDTFDGRSSFLTWLYRITVNASLMLLRRRRSRHRREQSLETPTYDDIRARELTDWGAQPDERLLTAEMRRIMDDAIAQLPDKYRAVFVLRDLEGLSTAETAKILNLTTANVKIRLMRARLFLREGIENYVGKSSKTEVGS